MEKDITLEYAAFLRSFKRNIDVPHSFLLGAGASISSGVQSAYDCIWEWKKDIFLSKNVNSSEYYKNFKLRFWFNRISYHFLHFVKLVDIIELKLHRFLAVESHHQ